MQKFKCEKCKKSYKTIYTLNRHMLEKHDIIIRTRQTPNDIVVRGDIAEIIILDVNNEEKCRAFIDVEDVEKCSKYKWGQWGNGYIQSAKLGISLHRFLIGDKPNMVCDHINRNPLDNRKENLRHVTYQENTQNKAQRAFKNKDTKYDSGQIGVIYRKCRNKWRVNIRNPFTGKKEEYGLFPFTEEGKQRAIEKAQEIRVKYGLPPNIR